MHISHGPDIISRCLQIVIHNHCPSAVKLYPCPLSVQAFRVGFSSGCDQHSICLQDLLLSFERQLHQGMAVCLGDLVDPGSQLKGHTAVFQHTLNSTRDIPVFSWDQHFPVLQNRHLCSES